MTAGKYRVVVWATGGIGSIAIRTITNRPELELVGVHRLQVARYVRRGDHRWCKSTGKPSFGCAV